MLKRILILYTSVGLGHKTIAENLAARFEAQGFEIKLEDIYKIQEGWLVNVGRKLHNFILTYIPGLWSFLYQSKIFTKFSLPWRVKVASRNYENTLLVIQAFKPDIVITTQTAASAVLEYLKQQKIYTGMFGIAFSDYHLHPYWLYDQADFYLANIEEQKQEMVSLGISAEKIFVLGMSLKPKPFVNEKEIKTKFNIGKGDKVVLITAGSLGLGLDSNLLASLATQRGIKTIVVCGKNFKMYESLRKKYTAPQVRVLSYYTPLSELYAIADVFITKPGGLSIAEALEWNLPILIFQMLPGQEELNYNYLQDKGLVMPEPINMLGELMEELETGNFKNKLKTNLNISPIIQGNKADAVKLLGLIKS